MAAILIKQWKLEPGLVGRGLEGFQRRSVVEVQPSGVSELDALLSGGFPRGSLVELCGDASSGRTSLAFSLLAQATERQEACAFVDVSDSLDPISLAAAGVELSRLLWIRCGESDGKEPDLTSSPYFAAGKEIEKGVGFEPERKKPVHVNGWKHPRELMRGVEHAIPMVMGSRHRFRHQRQVPLWPAVRESKWNAIARRHAAEFALPDLCRNSKVLRYAKHDSNQKASSRGNGSNKR
jgi:hypothetical protein